MKKRGNMKMSKYKHNQVVLITDPDGNIIKGIVTKDDIKPDLPNPINDYLNKLKYDIKVLYYYKDKVNVAYLTEKTLDDYQKLNKN